MTWFWATGNCDSHISTLFLKDMPSLPDTIHATIALGFLSHLNVSHLLCRQGPRDDRAAVPL